MPSLEDRLKEVDQSVNVAAGITPAPNPVVPEDKNSLDERIREANEGYAEITKDLTPEKLEFKKGNTQTVNFTMYDKKLEKLQSYGSRYQKYGYNPYVNNEKLYDDLTTNSEQWARSLYGASKLVKIGFTDNALFGAFSGKDSHKEYAKAVDFYTSSKGGATGFMQNLVLNGGYTVGIMADMALEELALAGLTAITFGGASETTLPTMAAKGAQSFKNIKNAYNMYSNLNKTIRTAGTVKKSQGMMKIANFLNPMGNTTNFIKTLRSADQLKDASDLTKTVLGTGALFRDVKAVHLAYTEANLEGNMLYDELYDELVANHKGPLSASDAERYRQQAERGPL